MFHKPVVMVSGASRGLGAAVASWLAKAGAGIALLARSEENLKKVADDARGLGGEPLVCRAEIANYDACLAAVKNTLRCFGRIDALVNNAGIVQPISKIARCDPADWRYNIEVNLVGPFNLIRGALSALRRQQGRIVNVSSGAANLVLENASAYCAAKAALNHFSRVLAAEEAALTVLTIRPGVVDTDMQVYLRTEGSKRLPADQAAYYQQLKDYGKLEPPAIPARSIAWLALHAPRQFSGQFFDYDDPSISRPAVETFGETPF